MKHAWEIDAAPVRWARFCNFGITELGIAIGGFLAAASIPAAETLGVVAADALGGAALGAGTSALMGKDPGKGALYGGITGGFLGGAGGIAADLGAGAAGTALIDVGMGAAGGAAGAAATGADPGKGALMGAAAGGVQGVAGALSGPTAGAAPGAAPAAGGGTSAATSAAPASIAAAGPDLTAPLSMTDPGIEAVTVGATRAGADVAGAAGAGATALGTGAMFGGDTGGGGAGNKPADPGSSLTTAKTPGSVDAGAATGTTSNVTGTNTTSNLAPGSANLNPQQQLMADIKNAPSPAPNLTSPVKAPDIGADVGPLNLSSQTPTLPAAAGPETSVGKFMQDPSLGNAGNVLASNPEMVLAAGGLGAQLMMGNKPPAGIAPVQAQAQHNVAAGNLLQSYLASGQLPPGMQANIDANTKAAEAAIRQRYSNMGMSGSSAEMQDIQSARLAAVGQAADMRTKLYSAGVQQSGLGTDLYNELLKINMEQDQNLSNAVGNFTSSMAGLAKPIAKPNSATV